jgi:hypothetical protein
MKKIFLCIVSIALLSNCSKEQTQQDQFNITRQVSKISSRQALSPENPVPTVQVLDPYNQPIENATVLVGSALDNPFQNNLMLTDKNGMVQNLTDWATAEHVSAEATGFVRQTLLSQQPGHIVIKLSAASQTTKSTVIGKVTQLPVVDRDKNIDFGIVMSALTRSDLLNFDLNAVISPVNDIMKVANYTLPIPSNVSLPKQKENYVIGLTIEKPEYRFLSQTLGTRRLFAAAGRFPFKTVVDELRAGKPFYDILNYFDLTGGGIRDVNITAGQMTQIDIPGNELKFKKSISVNSPQVNADEVFVTLTASEVSGFMIPTGVRKMDSQSTTSLNVLESYPTFTVNVIKRQSEFMATNPGADRLSASLLPYKAKTQPTMLPLINDPSVTNSNGYVIQMPILNSVQGVYSLAVSAIISDIEITGPADRPVTDYVRKWEILGTQWPTKIQLPNWPLDTISKKRFEINYVGSLTAKNIDLGDALINSATHVTHSSTEY